MGALQSLHDKFESVTSLEEEVEEESHESTPTRPINKRLLTFDPRSPSEGIDRTPIVVDKTPRPGISAVNSRLAKTPDTVIDPRSPSVEFTRTPINPCLMSGAERISRVQEAAAVSPTSTVTASSESGIESADVTPVKVQSGEISLESPDSALSVGEVPLDAPVLTGTADSSSSSCDIEENTPLVSKPSIDLKSDKANTPKLSSARCRPHVLNSNFNSLAVTQKLVMGTDSFSNGRSPLSSVGNSEMVVDRATQSLKAKQEELDVSCKHHNIGMQRDQNDLSVEKENNVH